MKYSDSTPTPNTYCDGNVPPLPDYELRESIIYNNNDLIMDILPYEDKEEEKPTPEENKDIQEFFINYNNEKEILNNKEYSLLVCYNKIKDKKFIVKNYSEDFINQIDKSNNNYLFYIEKDHFKNFHSKYIIKLVDYYSSINKRILVFEYFETTLKEILKEKKALTIDEIKNLLIQINEGVKHLNNKEINNIIISPENIGINKNLNIYSIQLLNLFPYYELKKNSKDDSIYCSSYFYLSPEYPPEYTKKFEDFNDLKEFKTEEKYIRNNNTKSFLWNIGILIYELFFGQSQFEQDNNQIKIDINNLKKTGNNLLDDLLSKLLIKDPKQRLKWDDYINHQFFNEIPLERICKVIYGKEINKNIQELDLHFEEIDEYNLVNLSKFNFNNLLKLNLSNNQIIDISFMEEKSFNEIRFLNIEKNKIRDLDEIKNNTLENVEILLLSSNLIRETDSFKNKKFPNLNYLSLSNNNIRNIDSLTQAELPNLSTLNLSYNKINNINFFSNLKSPQLQELYINNNNIKEISGLNKVQFKNLEVLNLDTNWINEINTFQNIPFQQKIKELYLSKNPISKFNLLNLCYFQSLEKISLPLNKFELQILSIKLKLFGYEFEKVEDDNDNISVLYLPYKLYQSYLLDNSIINNFTYKNTFKIITNKNVYIPKLNKFFIDNVLEIDSKDINIFNGNNNTSLNNENIFLYYGNDNIINQEIKKNTFYLIKEYKYLHKISDKFNRIPSYLEEKENNFYINISCPFKENNLNINDNDIINNQKIFDNQILLSKFSKRNYYYNIFPIIFINSMHYKNILNFLDNSNKYQEYKPLANLNKKIILSSNNNYKHKHTIENKNISIIVDIVENVDFYKIENIIDIINIIKNTIKGDYKIYINEFILNIMDIIVEYFLFVYNAKPYYYICPFCNSPILYIIENEKFNNNNIIDKDIIINENNNQEFDYCLLKSIKSWSSFNNIFFDIFQKNNCINFKNKYQLVNKDNNYIPANPPKKKKRKY